METTTNARLASAGGSGLHATLLLASVLIGAALALVAVPPLFRRLPNDQDRLRVILAALRSKSPEIVVFGDSRAVAGVDARQLTQQLRGHPVALNLSSHGQTLSDTLLLMDQTPRSVRTIVIVVGRDRLVNDTAFTPASYNALLMYGYEPRDEIRQLVWSAAGAEAKREIERPLVARIAAARWAMQQSFDMFAYAAARGASRRRERDDLHFPSIYGTRVDDRRFAFALRSIKVSQGACDSIHPRNRRLIDGLARIAASRHQQLMIVLAPAHPALVGPALNCELTPIDFAAKQGVEVLDATTLLADRDFADPLHVTHEGARKLTDAIGRRIVR